MDYVGIGRENVEVTNEQKNVNGSTTVKELKKEMNSTYEIVMENKILDGMQDENLSINQSITPFVVVPNRTAVTLTGTSAWGKIEITTSMTGTYEWKIDFKGNAKEVKWINTGSMSSSVSNKNIIVSGFSYKLSGMKHSGKISSRNGSSYAKVTYSGSLDKYFGVLEFKAKVSSQAISGSVEHKTPYLSKI